MNETELGYGALSLLPTAVVVVLALATKRTLESLLAGVVVGIFLLDASSPLTLLSNISLDVMMNETVAWIILVCGLMGSLIGLFIRTGAVQAFTQSVIARVSGRNGSLFTAWVLGLCLFVDDYLSCCCC